MTNTVRYKSPTVSLINRLTILFAASFITCCTAFATEQFTEWKPDSPVLNTLIDYVEMVTDSESPDYIPPEVRIAVFDMDGTLYPERNPAYLADYLLAHRILTDPLYEPDDDMLEYGRILRDHLLDGDFPDYVTDQFDDYFNRAFAVIPPETGGVARLTISEIKPATANQAGSTGV